jgi:hypothetical protein
MWSHKKRAAQFVRRPYRQPKHVVHRPNTPCDAHQPHIQYATTYSSHIHTTYTCSPVCGLPHRSFKIGAGATRAVVTHTRVCVKCTNQHAQRTGSGASESRDQPVLFRRRTLARLSRLRGSKRACPTFARHPRSGRPSRYLLRWYRPPHLRSLPSRAAVHINVHRTAASDTSAARRLFCAFSWCKEASYTQECLSTVACMAMPGSCDRPRLRCRTAAW